MGWLAIAAGIAFGAALLLLVTFFVTRDERYDRIAEWSFVAFALLAIPTMLTVAGRLPEGGLIVGTVTVVGIAGVAVLGLGELASTLRIVDFRRMAPLITLGFMAYLVWIGAVSVVVLARGGLPINLGWLGIVTIAVGAVIVGSIVTVPGVVGGQTEPPRGRMTAFFLPMAGIVAWMIWLGMSL